ncbi:MAG TPA: hypothetical protein VK636_14915 [Gemmatimonadaceae bacterium]|nr:hypothetical protein [Gemmatimonadaceae bacterium]
MIGMGFFQTLATRAPVDMEWLQLRAGFSVFRASHAALFVDESFEDIERDANEHIVKVIDFRLSGMLKRLLVSAVQADLPGQRPEIGAQLMAYGIELHSRGHLQAAVDVFTLVFDTATGDADIRLLAIQRRAFALRLLSQFDDAEVSYHQMIALAKQARDVSKRLEGQLGLAKVAIDRGNLPLARTAVQRVVRRAIRYSEPTIAAKAKIDLARIAGLSDDPIGALDFTRQALEWTTDANDRDRALMNMATALRELGRSFSAGAIAAELRVSAIDGDLRAKATVLAYNVAIDEGDQNMMRDCRDSLSVTVLPPLVEARFHEATARDAAARGETQEALAAIQRVLAIAESNKLAETIFTADRAMEDVLEGRIPALYSFRPIPPPAHAEHRLRRIEQAVLEHCSA